MQATSTPTLAQPKNSAFAALGGAAILAAAIGVGALIGANISTIAAPTAGNDSNVAAYALGVQRNGEIGALTPAQRGLALSARARSASVPRPRSRPSRSCPRASCSRPRPGPRSSGSVAATRRPRSTRTLASCPTTT